MVFSRATTRRAHDISQSHKFPAIVTAPNPREVSETFGSRRYDQRGETIDGHDPGHGRKTGSGLLRALSHDVIVYFSSRRCSRRILINGQKVSPSTFLPRTHVAIIVIYPCNFSSLLQSFIIKESKRIRPLILFLLNRSSSSNRLLSSETCL